MSLYPNNLDSNLEIPRVDDNITEVSADTINAIRDAVMAIEKALGTDIQGNLSDLAERINAVIDENGILKTAALSSKGLISLPIGNAQIGSSAAIEEGKIDLDYSTSYLNGRIASIRVDVEALRRSISSFLDLLTNHYSGTSNKHDGYQITMSSYTRSGAGTTVERAIHLLDNAFTDHLHSSSPHTAYNIPVSNNFRGISAQNVQEALQELSYVNPGVFAHLDRAHDNAIVSNRRSETGDVANLNITTMASTIYQTDTSLAKNILQVMRPNVARIIGGRIDFGALSASSAYNLRIYAGGMSRTYVDVDLTSAIPTTSTDDIVEEINTTLHSAANHYPVSAYNVDGRLVIAHNISGWGNTIEVLSTVSNSAHTALGFSSYSDTEYSWADGYCSAYVGGYQIDDFRSLIKTKYDHSAAADLNLINGFDDLRTNGFDISNTRLYLCNISNHSSDSTYNGTYYIISYYGTSGFYLNTDVAQGEFDLEVIENSTTFSDSSQGQIHDIFAEYVSDGYGKVSSSQRLSYSTHTNVDIKSVSRDFPQTSVQWKVTDREYIEIIENSESGTTVNIPSGFTGELRVYAPDNINSALIQVTGAPATTATHNITVTDFAETDDRLYLSSVHYSGNFGTKTLKYITDKRKIGGTVENKYQDRLSRVPLSEALRDLRNNGVIRGFDIISNTSSTIRVRGGRALIEGKLVDVKTKNITIDRFTGAKRLLMLDENGQYKTADIDAGGYDEDDFIVSDSYGDIRNVALVADFGTTASILDGTFTDRRLMINKIDKRLYDVENRLNRRIDNLFSSVGGAVWAFKLSTSSDAYGEYTGSVTLSSNTGLAQVDELGFAGGNAAITTRRFEIIDGYASNVFQSAGQTHLNVMLQFNYGAEDGGLFGTSGDVDVYCGLDVVTGTTIMSHEGSSRIVHNEYYVRVRSVDTTVFPIGNVTENYVISIPVSLFGDLENNMCFDALPRIKITGCDNIDGGATGSASPMISVGLIRVIGSSYSVAGSILGQDGNNTALAATVGEIL